MALDCVPYVGINRTDIQCTRLHTRGSGEVMKKSISLLLVSCITISYVIGCYGTVLLILVPSLSVHLIYPYFLLCCSSFTLSFCSSSPPPLPPWAFLFAILFLVFCPMNKIQAPGRSRASWSSVSTGQANKSFLWFLPRRPVGPPASQCSCWHCCSMPLHPLGRGSGSRGIVHSRSSSVREHLEILMKN